MYRRLILQGITIWIILAVSGGYVCADWPQNPLSRLFGGKNEESSKSNSLIDTNAIINNHCKVPGPVIKLQMAPNRKLLAATWYDTTQTRTAEHSNQTALKVNLWDVEFNHSSPEAAEELSAVSSVFSTAFDSQGLRFFVADAANDRPLNPLGLQKTNIRVFEPNRQRQIREILTDDFDETRIRLSQDAHWIACLNRDGIWRLIDRNEPKRVVVFPEIEVEVASKTFDSKQKKKCYVTEILGFSPGNDLVATLVSDLVEPEQQASLPSDSSDESLAEEKGVYRTIVIWDLLVVGTIKLEDVKKLPLEAIKVSTFRAKDGVQRRRCAFSNDSTMIAVRSKSKYIGVWQTANGQLFAELGEHDEHITSLAISPNNLKLVVGTGETKGRLVQWDIRKETIDRIYEESDPQIKKITAVTFSPDGYTILFGTDTGEIKSWQIEK